MLKTIVLGVIQGLTEFLPVSSSGHLVLFQRLFRMPETGLLLEILLHVGTLAAVIAVFWRDWVEMLLHLTKNRVIRLLVVATIPAVVVTLLAGDWLEKAFSGWFLGLSFLVTSALLLASDWLAGRAARAGEAGKSGAAGRLSRTQHRRMRVEDMRYQQALAMGVMQAVAIVPGISRSGATIVGGLAAGVTRRTAAKFSFLMSAVATVGSLVFKLRDLIDVGATAFEGGWPAAVAGMLAAAISGYLAIRWMLSLIQRISLKWFGLYTAALGVLVLCDQLFTGFVFDKII